MQKLFWIIRSKKEAEIAVIVMLALFVILSVAGPTGNVKVDEYLESGKYLISYRDELYSVSSWHWWINVFIYQPTAWAGAYLIFSLIYSFLSLVGISRETIDLSPIFALFYIGVRGFTLMFLAGFLASSWDYLFTIYRTVIA